MWSEMANGNQLNIDRRTVLKSTTVAAATGVTVSVVGTSAAEDSSLNAGKQHVVETKLEHPDLPRDHTGTRCGGLPPYYVEPRKGRIFPETIDLDDVRNGDIAVIRSNEVYAEGDQFPSEYRFWRKTGYRKTIGDYINVVDGYDLPDVEIEYSEEDDRRISVSVDDQSFEVEAGELKRVELDGKSVRVRKPSEEYTYVENPRDVGPDELKMFDEGTVEEIVTTPVFSVRNLGDVNVFGKRGATVLPTDSEDPIADRREAAVRRAIEEEEIPGEEHESENEDGEKFLIIHRNRGDN